MATILIVDDEEPVRDLLAILLEDAGHRTLRAIHGRQALDLIEAEPPDLVISDVMMPVLNGHELEERLQARPGTRHIPVILMSAAWEHGAGAIEADRFLAKPFDFRELERLVQRWLAPARRAAERPD